ncbi:MAG: sensor histidine kinase [Chitinophagaceae bacterium]|nr:sensor histidine kinase [Chitinophagaceae bacterium]
MKLFVSKGGRGPGIPIYELMIWVIYVSLYKYGVTLESRALPHIRENFPFPQLMLYCIATTAYVIPLYRGIGPWLLRRRRYVLLGLLSGVYFLFFMKWCNWGVTHLFKMLNTNPALDNFYVSQARWYDHSLLNLSLHGSEHLIDPLVFFSIMFMRWGFENERKRHDLERDHLVLQLETLKAQLHPHFLFNTLNSIYGMSLTGAKDTPSFILRLSDMMRYVLYDCQGNQVLLDKDLTFVGNYLEMEKKRYPMADISFDIMAPDREKITIAPLLLIPFLENSFKHGSQRVADSGFIRGRVEVADGALHFTLSNSVLTGMPVRSGQYGGVGIENVRKRLALYYPERHTLQITGNGDVYTVDLKIRL